MHVDEERILQPLGVKVIGDSRYELLPGTRDYTEEIPGRHGEIDFGSELKARILELHCAVESDDIPSKLREIAGYLNPCLGEQELTFADEPGKVYHVKYSGKIDLTRYPTWAEFTIPFKMVNPFITSATEKSIQGSGTAVNEGTFETPFIITIQGPATNPTVTVNEFELIYVGTLTSSDIVVIDTEKLTVTLNGNNALANYIGTFPKLQPGNNTVSSNGGTVTFRWYDRWL